MDSLDPPKTPDPVAMAILLWAALALVPVGLRQCADADRRKLAASILHIVVYLQTPAAILLAASFLLDQGAQAAALAVPWFGVTLLVAAVGGLDLVRRRWGLDSQAALAAAMLFLPVGGGWAVISRAGLRPQDFSHAIVLLTAVHFHYAGFVLPVLAGLTTSGGRNSAIRNTPSPQPSPKGRGSQIDRTMLAAIIAGVPLVGVGISLSPHIEVTAAGVLTVGCVLLALRQFQIAVATRNPTSVALLGISSLSLLLAMGLAVAYAVGEFTGQQMLSVPTMIRSHGLANALGFATCGFAAWTIRSQPAAIPR